MIGTLKLRQMVIEQFKAGRSVKQLALWHKRFAVEIEQIIRDELNEAGNDEQSL